MKNQLKIFSILKQKHKIGCQIIQLIIMKLNAKVQQKNQKNMIISLDVRDKGKYIVTFVFSIKKLKKIQKRKSFLNIKDV